eukprot:131967_1
MEGQSTQNPAAPTYQQAAYNPGYMQEPVASVPQQYQNTTYAQQYQNTTYAQQQYAVHNQYQQQVAQSVYQPVQQPIIIQQPIMQQTHTITVGRPRGYKPCIATCAMCKHTNTTRVERSTGTKYWGLCGISLFFVWMCACCFVPCFDCSYDHYHYCAKCGNVIAKDNEFEC